MATTLQVSQVLGQTIVETFPTADLPSASSASITHNQFNSSTTLNATSTPPASMKYCDTLTGTTHLDLTALADPLGTVDGTGLKVQSLLVNNLSTTDALVISDGAANEYALNAAADITVAIGGSVLMYFNDQLADISATAKTIDFTPAAGKSYEVSIVMG